MTLVSVCRASLAAQVRFAHDFLDPRTARHASRSRRSAAHRATSCRWRRWASSNSSRAKSPGDAEVQRRSCSPAASPATSSPTPISTTWRRSASGEPVEGDPARGARTFALLESMPQPVVAAVDGQAWGGGCELSLACTLRVASDRAHFGQPEVAVGIIPGAGGTQRLPRLVGAGRAAELVPLGSHHRRRTKRCASGWSRRCSRPTGSSSASSSGCSASRPSRRPRFAAKRAVVDGLRLPLDEGLRLEGRLFIECQMRPTRSRSKSASPRPNARAPADRARRPGVSHSGERDEVEEVVGPVVDDAVGHQQHPVRARAR